MKFAHIADSHLGAWDDPELTVLGLEAFRKALDISIERDVDFILLCGDILDWSNPPVNVLVPAVEKLEEARDKGIKVYTIPGSHDFSASGKTMLRVFEAAKLMENVTKATNQEENKLKLEFTEFDENVKITGLPGRKGGLEAGYYEDLDRESLEKESGFKIFAFHSAIEEYKPEIFKKMEALPLSLLPKGFNYYAGGHVHKRDVFEEEGYGKIVFPGPTFPTNYRELERFESGGFYLVNFENGEINLDWIEIKLCDVVSLEFDAQNKNPPEVESEIKERVEELEVEDKIILLRIEGELKEGKPTEINLSNITRDLKLEGAKSVRTNTNKLSTKEYETVRVKASNKKELEKKLIEENVEQFDLEGLSKDEKVKLTKKMMSLLSKEQGEDETNTKYKKRITEEAFKALDLKEKLEEFL